ncbi:MAG TPA: LamG domain-containing protein, partial [Chloroflexota bacterium]|nr:LamG domain-containing protein [Chloroflexota bacterium]
MPHCPLTEVTTQHRLVILVTTVTILHLLFISLDRSEAAAATALQFDGTSAYVQVPDSPSLRLSTNLTVEAWVKPSPTSGHRHIIQKDYFELALEPLDTGVQILFEFRANGQWYQVGSGRLEPSRWYHVAATYNGSTARLFIDGLQVRSAAVSGLIDQSTAPLMIGQGTGLNDHFPGLVDEVRISSVVRYTASFTAPTAPFTADANTRGLWHFDEGAGTTAQDASANGNNGTLINGPVWTTDSPFSTPAPAATATPSPSPTAVPPTPTAAPPTPTWTPAPAAPTATPTWTAVPAAPTATPTWTPPAAVPTATPTPTWTPVPAAPTATPTATAAGPLSAGFTSPGALTLRATYQSIGVYANFSGDGDGDNRATLEYRKAGEPTWHRGMDLTVDRRATVFGADASYPNPFKNQWRAAVLLTQADTEYEVRVTFSDPDGVAAPNPVVARVRTRGDNPPAAGTTYYVAPTGADTNPGSAAAPWRTLQKAAGA